MKISREEILHVAGLSRLHLSEEDIDRLSPQLDRILAYMDTLQAVDTEGVPSMSHALRHVNALRKDEVLEQFPIETVFRNAPEEEDGLFVVPKVIG